MKLLTRPVSMLCTPSAQTIALLKRLGETRANEQAAASEQTFHARLRAKLAAWRLPGVERTPAQRKAADPVL